jgi:two-component system NtrC family sensor kinase
MRASKNLEEGLRTLRVRVVDSLAGRVVNSGEPLYVDSGTPQKIKTAYLVRSLIYVPLKVGDRVIGVLGVHNRTATGTLTKDVMASMTALADYASIAIVNAELYGEADSERERFSKILNQIQDGVLLVDEHDRIALCNPVARDLLDLADGDFIGQRLVNLTSNRQLLDLLEDSKQRTTRPLHGDVSHGGKVFNAHISEILGLGRAVVMQDITDLKELDRIKSELVLMVSHDLRSPLTAILTYTELMGRVGELNEQQKEFTQQARTSVEAITSLINDLLDLGKIEARADKDREQVDMVTLAEQAIRIVQQQADLKKQMIILDAAENTPSMLGNALQLRQLFTNLLDNAIKYSNEKGEIRVRIFGEADSVIVVISDDGIGIPREDQPRIFDRFYRVKDVAETHAGTGLGLNIVKSIVDSHSGRVWVRSTPGKGTTFTIVLPAVTASNLQKEAASRT